MTMVHNKSTNVRCLNFLERPMGEILIDGKWKFLPAGSPAGFFVLKVLDAN